ncbi:MAG: FAD:protein FMN transferase [Candidatus Omnitrophica bacterium]|nr:FAD:protein FMN transferase [Candidatus Omnitrophota bacterium]
MSQITGKKTSAIPSTRPLASLRISFGRCNLLSAIHLDFLFLFFGLVFLTSCAKPMHKDKFVIAGTFLEVMSTDARASQIVYEEFKRLDKIFNFYDKNSEISRLNSTYNTPVKVSPELLEVLRLSQQLNQMTNGAFDVSYGSLYDFWKELIKKGSIKELPSKETIDSIMKNCGMDKIKIDAADSTVTLQKEGLKIDLGAIAEGYMVDKAVIALKKKGISSALINAGGDIYCLGTNRKNPWRVGIKNPSEIEGIIENEDLVDEAITTSGNYEQFFDLGGKRYSHIIDPRTGFPVATHVISASVITKNCTTADGLATAFFVGGISGVNDFLSKYRSTMRIFLVTQEGKQKRVHVFR